MDVLVGLDAGTTATKAVTAGPDAVVRDVVSVGYPLLVPAGSTRWVQRAKTGPTQLSSRPCRYRLGDCGGSRQ